MTRIMSHGFLCMWLDWAHELSYKLWLVKGCCAVDSGESAVYFTLWLATSHRGCAMQEDESPGLEWWEDAYIRGLFLTKRYKPHAII